jgi:hypothetical protein
MRIAIFLSIVCFTFFKFFANDDAHAKDEKVKCEIFRHYRFCNFCSAQLEKVCHLKLNHIKISAAFFERHHQDSEQEIELKF